jgi:hypothetical protein
VTGKKAPAHFSNLAARFVSLLCGDGQEQAAYIAIAREALAAGVAREHIEEAFSRAASTVFCDMRLATRLVKVFRADLARA